MLFSITLKAQYAIHDSLSLDSCIKGQKTILIPTYNHVITGIYVPLKGLSYGLLYNSLKANLSTAAESGVYTNANKVRLGGTLLENALVRGNSGAYSMTFDSISGFRAYNNFTGNIQFDFRISTSNLSNKWSVKNNSTQVTSYLNMNTTFPQFGMVDNVTLLDAFIRMSKPTGLEIEINNNSKGSLLINDNLESMSIHGTNTVSAPVVAFYNIQNDSINLGTKFGTTLPAPTNPIQVGYVPTLIDVNLGKWLWKPPTGGSGGGGNTIYNANDALTSNRTVDGNNKSLDFHNVTDFKIDSTSTYEFTSKYTAGLSNTLININEFGQLYRYNNPNGESTNGNGRANELYIGQDGVAIQSIPSFNNPIPLSTNRIEANNRFVKVKTNRLSSIGAVETSDAATTRKIGQGQFPIAYNYAGEGTNRNSTDGNLIYSGYRMPLIIPSTSHYLVTSGDSVTVIKADTADYSRKATLNLVGFSENLPITAGNQFETFYMVPSEMNGWTLNKWELTLGEQAHTAGSLVFDLVRVPVGGAIGIGTQLSKQITLAANNRYAVYGSTFSQTVSAGDIIQIKFVSNTGIVGSPRGLAVKLNFVR